MESRNPQHPNPQNPELPSNTPLDRPSDLTPDLAPEEPPGRLPAWLTETPFWAVSAVAHLFLLLALAGVVLLDLEEDAKKTRTIVVKRAEKVRPYDPKPRRDVKWNPKSEPEKKDKTIVELKVEVEVEPPPLSEKHTNVQQHDSGLTDVFGSSGLAAGLYSNRPGKGRKVSAQGGGATEDAVLAALHWLRRHQHEDGHWSSHDFFPCCEDPTKPCGMKSDEGAFTDGRGWPGHDVGVTGLAMLAYLGYGHTHTMGKYREFRQVMRKARKWMLKQQIFSDDVQVHGRFGPGESQEWVYDHAIATMAMAELLVLSRDFRLRKSVEAATELCLARQNPGSGWRYGFREGNDTSVTGWMVLALKTSRACAEMRLVSMEPQRFDPHFAGALRCFQHATSVSGITGYQSPGDRGSQINDLYPEPYPYSKDLSCMTAVAVLGRLFAGESRRSEKVKQGVHILMKELPRWQVASGKRKSKINMYHWYYASYALFQHGGRPWKTWNTAMLKALLPNQRVAGCEDGSWDPIGEWGGAGGRVYATAIGAMTLEVYYRFRRITEGTETGSSSTSRRNG